MYKIGDSQMGFDLNVAGNKFHEDEGKKEIILEAEAID
jgi:hypothetical protein